MEDASVREANMVLLDVRRKTPTHFTPVLHITNANKYKGRVKDRSRDPKIKTFLAIKGLHFRFEFIKNKRCNGST
jgi:hypothetical protein